MSKSKHAVSTPRHPVQAKSCSGNGATRALPIHRNGWRGKKIIIKNYIHLNCCASSSFWVLELRPTTHDLPWVGFFH
ncbi:hypothetical protein B0H12DRAFT_1110960 [Mycena haematopus]|nr:hypothetical protein B0H12DRAFT_1110960 [Mycena haematopus]